MKNIFAILSVVLLASCGSATTEEVVVTDTTAVEVVEVEVVVDTTQVDTTVAE